jgi:hypothetical protein
MRTRTQIREAHLNRMVDHCAPLTTVASSRLHCGVSRITYHLVAIDLPKVLYLIRGIHARLGIKVSFADT